MNHPAALHPKVASATIAGAITAVVIYCLQQYAHTDIPPTIAAAITTLLTFIFGYIAPMMPDNVPIAITLPTEPPEDGTTEPTAGQKAIAPAKS